MRSSRLWMRSSRVWMRSSREWIRSSREWMRSSREWMRSSRCGGDLAEWLERLAVNAKVATVLDSIPASFDIVKSKEWQRKQCWITDIKKFPFTFIVTCKNTSEVLKTNFFTPALSTLFLHKSKYLFAPYVLFQSFFLSKYFLSLFR
jgi:hypothetical protein